MPLHLYEFLYRGRPAGSAEPPDYHVVLAADGTDAFGRSNYALSPAMTPAQAEAEGFGLPEILAAIDAGLLAENAALRAQNDALRAAGAVPPPVPPSALRLTPSA